MAVECSRCKAKNTDGKKFCGDCGAPLGSTAGVIGTAANSALRDQVQEIIAQHYKDQKVVEIETTQAIASRLLDWAKLLAFFVGIPIALLLLTFGALGIKTYNDLSTQVDKAKAEIVGQLTAAQTNAAKLKSEGDSLANDYKKLRAQFSDTAALGEQLKMLSAKVDVIGEKLGFTDTSKATPELKSALERDFQKFISYLKGVGFPPPNDRIEVEITDRPKFDLSAYYDAETNKLIIRDQYAADSDLLFHAFMHYALTRDSNLPRLSNENWAYASVKAGLAIYFPCSFIDKPRFGEKAATLMKAPPYTIGQYRSFKDIKWTVNDAFYNGEIWGNAFWELRKVLGQPAADKLLYQAWLKLDPDAIRADNGLSFVRLLIAGDTNHQTQVRAIFTERGLTP